MSTALNLAMQITANTQGVSAAVGNVNKSLESMAAAGKKAAADLGVLKTIEISRLFVTAVTNAASSFQSLVTGAASSVASIDDLSKRTGVSTTALQAYQFAADQSGVSIETFGKSLQKLTINLGEAQNGNANAIKSFAELGLSVDELSRLSPQVAFEKVAAAIAELPNPAQQAAAAVSLFGKSGIDLVPVFQEGAQFLEQMRLEAERLGTVLSSDQVGNLAALDDSIAKVSASFKGLTARVVAELAPALTVAADQLATFLGSLDARDVVGSLSDSLGGLFDVASAVGNAFTLLANVFTPLAQTILPIVAQTLGFIVTNLQGAATGALLVAGAYAGYSLAAVTAAGATAALTAAIRGLLASTGIGLLVVVLGAVTGAIVDYAVSGTDGANEVSAAIEENNRRIEDLKTKLNEATGDAQELGKELKAAFNLPAEVTDQTLLQGLVDEASQAFKRLAQDIGRLDAVPQNLLDAVETLRFDLESVNEGLGDQAVNQDLIAQSAQKVLDIVKQIGDQRDEEKKKIDDIVAGVKRAQEFEKDLADEKRRRVEDVTRRELQAQEDIERRVREFEADRLRGLQTRFNEPLRISDVRTNEGISQVIALATGREDPAVEEARRQTAELEAMNRKLDELRAEKVEIMGGA